MDAEVGQLDRLGAAVARRYPDHTVMTDPEGNKLCVEPGPRSRRTVCRLGLSAQIIRYRATFAHDGDG